MTDDTRVPPCQGHAFQDDWVLNTGTPPDLPRYSIVEIRYLSGYPGCGYVNSYCWDIDHPDLKDAAIKEYRVVRVGA